MLRERPASVYADLSLKTESLSFMTRFKNKEAEDYLCLFDIKT
jgi:hypothetical protein